MGKDEAPTGREPVTPAADLRWALLERISASPHMQRSARLRELLHYLCRRAWAGGATMIREHDIGVDVFQRLKQYDSAQDTIVRVQASQVRKRLERYFSEEGREEPWILEIPKGSYLPVLRERVRDEGPVVAAPAGPEFNRWRPAFLAAVGVSLLSLVFCGWLLFRQANPPPSAGAGGSLGRFWSAFTANGRETFIVMADSAFSAIQDILRRPITLDEYIRRSYRRDFEEQSLSSERKEFVRYLMERKYTSLADVMVVRRLSLAGVMDPARMSVVFSREHNLRALQTANQILVGSRRAIPWVDSFDESLDFHFRYDETTRRVRVENRRPRQGEPPWFDLPPRTPNGGETFALIACLPNLGKTGNVLILSGQEMSGTEAAGNLVTSDSFLKDLMGHLPPVETGRVPYFEVLLKTRHIEYTTSGFEILAIHAHPSAERPRTSAEN